MLTPFARLSLLFILLYPFLSISQTDTLSLSPEILLEDYVEKDESSLEDFDHNTIFESLQYYIKRPLDINSVTEEELLDIKLLSGIQITNFLHYRNTLGPFISLHELQAIPSMDLQTIQTILPYLTINELGSKANLNFSDILRDGSSTFYFKWKRTLEDRVGFIPGENGQTKYMGNPNHYYARYVFNSQNKFKIGFTAEKDAGETFFKGNNRYGFDYYSFHIYAQKISNEINTLAIGDYTVSLGQGLILHNGFGAGKSSLVMNVKKGGKVIRPYSSINEVNFFRGMAATVKPFKNIKISLFGSQKAIDGKIDVSKINDNRSNGFTSISSDGYHRTQSEIEKKHSVNHKTAGLNVKYEYKSLKFGISSLINMFSLPLLSDDDLYKKYRFSGDKLINTSLDYSYLWRNFNLFGELAISDNGGKAQIHGLLATLDKKVDLSLVYRNYEKNYQVINGNAFAESSDPTNEEGIYVGSIVRITKQVKLSTYFDIWHHPWLKYRKDASTEGKEFLCRLEYFKKKHFKFYIQYRQERKYINDNDPARKIDGPEAITLQKLRFNLNSQVSKDIELRSRIELSVFDQNNHRDKGFLIFQDIIYKPKGLPYSFTARYAIFDIDDYDARIYAYENDLLYEHRIPFYQNRGSRYYLNFRLKLIKNATFEFRIAQSHINNKDNISTGNQLISGDTFTEIKSQLRLSF